MTESEAAASETTTPEAPKSKLLRNFAIGVFALVVLVFCLPWIIAGTPLRNVLVNMAISDQDVQADVGGASLGWFSPLALEDLKVDIRQGETVLTIRGVQADRSWIDILMERPELGTFNIEKPTIDVLLTDSQEEQPDEPESDSRPGQTTVSVAVRDGAFTLRVPEEDKPILKIRGFDASVHLEQGWKGRRLRIEPGTLLDHQKLTPEMCNQGLHLIAPILGNSTHANGEISLALAKFELPLDLPENQRPLEQADIQGNLHLHSVETGLKSPLLINIARLISSLLKKDVPTTMQIADDANILFRISDGRIHHQGLAFGLPELSADMVIRSEGSVGFDRSLDLKVSVPLPLNLVFDGALADRISEKPIQLHITGTLDQPKTQLIGGGEGVQGLLSGILSNLNGPSDSDDPNREVGETEEIVGGVLNLIQDAVEARKKRKENGPEGESDKPPTVLERIRKRREEGSRDQPNLPTRPPAPPR